MSVYFRNVFRGPRGAKTIQSSTSYCESIMFRLFSFLAIVGTVNAAYRVVSDANISAFRRVGYLTDGAGHAHLHVAFNVSDEVRVAKDLLTSVEFAAGNSSQFLWQPFLTRLRPIVKDWVSFEKTVSALCDKQPAADGLGRRDKRQAVILGAAAIVSAVGFGAWSIRETKVLADRMSGLDKSVNHLFASVTSSLRVEKDLKADIDHLHASLVNVSNVVGGLANFELEYGAADSIAHRLATRLPALRGLLRHHLPAELLEDEELVSGFERLRRRVEAAGYRLVIDNLLQLLSQQVSFTATEGVVDMWIHLPVLPRDQPPALLFQHLPLPVRRGSEVALVSGEEQFLAVFKEANNFVPLSTSDIAACYSSNLDFSCAASFPRIRGGSTACLPALYDEERLDAAAASCKVEPLRQDEAVFRLNATAFVIATRKPRQVDVRCGDDPEEKAASVHGVALVALDDGCVATTEGILFTARTTHLPEDLHVTIQGPSLSKFNATVIAGSNFRPTIAPLMNNTGEEQADLDAARRELSEGEKAEAEAEAEAASSWLPSWPRWGTWAGSGLSFLGALGLFICLGKSPVGGLLRRLCARHAGAALAAQAADAVIHAAAPPSPPVQRAQQSLTRALAPAPPAVTPVCVTVNNSSESFSAPACVRASPSRENSASPRARSGSSSVAAAPVELHPDSVVFRLI